MSARTAGARHFHLELAEFKSRLLEMSGLAEDQVRMAVEAFLDSNVGMAAEVIVRDKRVDELELVLDKAAHELLALQQPMAGDLRFITMAMKIANDLERVGDHAVNIARAVQVMAEMLPTGRAPEVVEMARLARRMLDDALDCFVQGDPDAAREVCAADDRVDHLHDSVFRILLTHMMEDPRWIGPSMSLLLISKNLERIADLATNIAEDVVFMVEGVVIKHPGKGHGGEPAVSAT
ncbi:MAG: phosphate signaling complex protein PhoU [Gemmatimonadetes bacterium]|nr:phosphate signaling complex protein PhoU [Gemmatimonadota bacterium]